VIVNLGSLTLLLDSGLNKYIASPISIELAIALNMLLNNYWTFAEKRFSSRSLLKGLIYNKVSFYTFAACYLTFIMLSQLFPDMKPQVSQAAGIVPATIVNYILNAYRISGRRSRPGKRVD
jgi:dolichol-phosphate mannosyltransferase